MIWVQYDCCDENDLMKVRQCDCVCPEIGIDNTQRSKRPPSYYGPGDVGEPVQRPRFRRRINETINLANEDSEDEGTESLSLIRGMQDAGMRQVANEGDPHGGNVLSVARRLGRVARIPATDNYASHHRRMSVAEMNHLTSLVNLRLERNIAFAREENWELPVNDMTYDELIDVLGRGNERKATMPWEWFNEIGNKANHIEDIVCNVCLSNIEVNTSKDHSKACLSAEEARNSEDKTYISRVHCRNKDQTEEEVWHDFCTPCLRKYLELSKGTTCPFCKADWLEGYKNKKERSLGAVWDGYQWKQRHHGKIINEIDI